MTASICAIVINYFGADKTAKCLRSIANEPIKTMILIDNSACARQRDTLVILKDELESANCSYNIRLIFHQRNLGFGRAINRAILSDVSSGSGHDYYLLLNNDTVATTPFVACLVRAFAENPTLALAAPQIHWGDRNLTYYWYQPFFGSVATKPSLGAFCYLSGCCLLVDASVVNDGRLFDEDFFMYGEDAELSFRVKKLGRTIACLKETLIFHEGSGSSQQGGMFYEYHIVCGHLMLAHKLANGPIWRFIFVIGRIVYLPARALIRCIRFRQVTPIKALLEALLLGTVPSEPEVTNPKKSEI